MLDEPTANLDPITERGLLDATYEATRERAALVVTHRLVRVEKTDESSWCSVRAVSSSVVPTKNSCARTARTARCSRRSEKCS